MHRPFISVINTVVNNLIHSMAHQWYDNEMTMTMK